jgi:hypothetical protein
MIIFDSSDTCVDASGVSRVAGAGCRVPAEHLAGSVPADPVAAVAARRDPVIPGSERASLYDRPHGLRRSSRRSYPRLDRT